MFKRLVDVLVSLCALVIALPVIVVISIAVCRNDGFPILFRQRRVGRDGHEFVMYKFRTMRVDIAASRGAFDAGNTSRVTRLGAILRRWKLDEIPQFWNVLIGDMSMVGPRPEVQKWVDVYPERWARIHKVRPGITDPASIAFRHEEEILSESDDPERTYAEKILPTKLAIYEQYASGKQTVYRDATILVKTLTAIISPRREAA